METLEIGEKYILKLTRVLLVSLFRCLSIGNMETFALCSSLSSVNREKRIYVLFFYITLIL